MNVISLNLKLLWERITFSRVTVFYFIFSIAHCFIQVVLQVQAFSINDQAATFLHSILEQGNASDTIGFTVLGKNDLRMCDHVPNSFSASSCTVLWNGTALEDNVKVPSGSSNSSASKLVPARKDSKSSSSSSATRSVAHTSSAITSTKTASRLHVGNAAAVPSATKTLTVFTTVTSHPYMKTGDDARKRKRDYADADTITTINVDGQIQVKVNGIGYNNEDIILDRTCLWALNYPVDVLLNTKREDVTFIAFQFWVLGMSIVAILNESIPHIISSLLTHMLATAWSAFQISHTATFRADISRLTTNGACKPINLLPQYWKDRGNAEIPSLVLNIVALIVSAFLSWRLVKLFGWQTFKRVGASLTINRLYKLVLTLSIVIQLSFFFMVVTIGLWLDQLWNGPMAHLAKLANIYRPVFLVTFVLLFPWIMTGWFAVRRELRIPMLVFLLLSFGYLLGWGAMFASATYRWTFVQWRFFSLMASGSALLTLIAFVLGLICRMNFGKGLPRYLAAQEPIFDTSLPDSFVPPTEERDPEKIDFPSHAQVIPTFSIAFGSGGDVQPPSEMFVGHQRGPRLYMGSEEPFEQHVDGHLADEPPNYVRSLSSNSHSLEHDGSLPSLARQNSCNSERSLGSSPQTTVERTNSQSSQSSSIYSKRWVIE